MMHELHHDWLFPSILCTLRRAQKLARIAGTSRPFWNWAIGQNQAAMKACQEGAGEKPSFTFFILGLAFTRLHHVKGRLSMLTFSFPMARLLRVIAVAMLAVMFISACGGGGGGGPSSPTPEPTPPPEPPPPVEECIDTHGEGCLTQSQYQSEVATRAQVYREDSYFMSQKELETIGADRAYSHLNLALGDDVKPGAGVTVGVLDSGIDANHPSFANIQVDETFRPRAENEPVDCTTVEMSRCRSHGTSVSSIIAAERYDAEAQSSQPPRNPQGIAWGLILRFSQYLRAKEAVYILR